MYKNIVALYTINVNLLLIKLITFMHPMTHTNTFLHLDFSYGNNKRRFLPVFYNWDLLQLLGRGHSKCCR